MNSLKKILSVSLALSMLATSGNFVEVVSAAPAIFVAPSNLPQFRLIPPGSLGQISDYFNASPDAKSTRFPLVVLIQDLHANYGVQQNIAGLLNFLDKKLSSASTASSTLPFALAIEGGSGPVDNSVMAHYPNASIKEAMARYLMKEGELTGAEYFAIMRSMTGVVTGVENDSYYQIHRELFRKTWTERASLIEALKTLQSDMNRLPRHTYKGAVKALYRRAHQHELGAISDTEFIGMLVADAQANGISIQKGFPALSAFAANGHLASPNALTPEALRQATADLLIHVQNAFSAQEQKNLSALGHQGGTAEYYLYLRDLIYQHQLFLMVPMELAQYLEFLHSAHTGAMNRIVHEADELNFQLMVHATGDQSERDLLQVQHDLDLLQRLANLQATEEEVRDFAPRLPQFIALAKSLLADDAPSAPLNLTTIRPLISSSVDYYVMALLRNEPMVDNTLALLATNKKAPVDTAVLVAGGFHTAAITQILQKKNISYVVLTPMVDELSDADHALYVKRLNGNLLTEREVIVNASAIAHEGLKLASAAHLPDTGLSIGPKRVLPGVALAVALAIFAGGTRLGKALPMFKKQIQPIVTLPEVRSWEDSIDAELQEPVAVTPPASDIPDALVLADLHAQARRLQDWKSNSFDPIHRLAYVVAGKENHLPDSFETETKFVAAIKTLLSAKTVIEAQQALADANVQYNTLLSLQPSYAQATPANVLQEAYSFLRLNSSSLFQTANPSVTLSASIRAKWTELRDSMKREQNRKALDFAGAQNVAHMTLYVSALELEIYRHRLETQTASSPSHSTTFKSDRQLQAWWHWPLYFIGNTVHELSHAFIALIGPFTLTEINIGSDPHITVKEWESDALRGTPSKQIAQYLWARVLAHAGLGGNLLVAVPLIIYSAFHAWPNHNYPFVILSLWIALSNLLVGFATPVSPELSDRIKAAHFSNRLNRAYAAVRMGLHFVPTNGDLVNTPNTTRFNSNKIGLNRPFYPRRHVLVGGGDPQTRRVKFTEDLWIRSVDDAKKFQFHVTIEPMTGRVIMERSDSQGPVSLQTVFGQLGQPMGVYPDSPLYGQLIRGEKPGDLPLFNFTITHVSGETYEVSYNDLGHPAGTTLEYQPTVSYEDEVALQELEIIKIGGNRAGEQSHEGEFRGPFEIIAGKTHFNLEVRGEELLISHPLLSQPQRFSLNRDIQVGRAAADALTPSKTPNQMVVILDPNLSGIHFKVNVSRNDNGVPHFTVTDLNSLYGTEVRWTKPGEAESPARRTVLFGGETIEDLPRGNLDTYFLNPMKITVGNSTLHVRVEGEKVIVNGIAGTTILKNREFPLNQRIVVGSRAASEDTDDQALSSNYLGLPEDHTLLENHFAFIARTETINGHPFSRIALEDLETPKGTQAEWNMPTDAPLPGPWPTIKQRVGGLLKDDTLRVPFDVFEKNTIFIRPGTPSPKYFYNLVIDRHLGIARLDRINVTNTLALDRSPEFALGEELTVGRDAEVKYPVNDEALKPLQFHLKITREDGVLMLELKDYESHFGTLVYWTKPSPAFINAARLTDAEVRSQLRFLDIPLQGLKTAMESSDIPKLYSEYLQAGGQPNADISQEKLQSEIDQFTSRDAAINDRVVEAGLLLTNAELSSTIASINKEIESLKRDVTRSQERLKDAVKAAIIQRDSAGKVILPDGVVKELAALLATEIAPTEFDAFFQENVLKSSWSGERVERILRILTQLRDAHPDMKTVEWHTREVVLAFEEVKPYYDAAVKRSPTISDPSDPFYKIELIDQRGVPSVLFAPKESNEENHVLLGLRFIPLQQARREVAVGLYRIVDRGDRRSLALPKPDVADSPSDTSVRFNSVAVVAGLVVAGAFYGVPLLAVGGIVLGLYLAYHQVFHSWNPAAPLVRFLTRRSRARKAEANAIQAETKATAGLDGTDLDSIANVPKDKVQAGRVGIGVFATQA